MIPISDQRRMLEQHVDAALDDLATLLLTHRDVIRRRALERVTTEGLEVYGDRTWHRPLHELVPEAIDELADGAFYLVPPLAFEAGDLVSFGVR